MQLNDATPHDEHALGAFDELVECERDDRPRDRQSGRAGEVLVPAMVEVVTEVRSDPRQPELPVRPLRFAGDVAGEPLQVGVVVCRRSGGAVDRLGSGAAGLGQVAGEVEQRLVQLGQSGRLGGPVVHLDVDVGRVVGAPAGTDIDVPDALQVRRLRTGAAAGDEQVPTEVEVPLGRRRRP